jgi:hypothetical protein
MPLRSAIDHACFHWGEAIILRWPVLDRRIEGSATAQPAARRVTAPKFCRNGQEKSIALNLPSIEVTLTVSCRLIAR